MKVRDGASLLVAAALIAAEDGTIHMVRAQYYFGERRVGIDVYVGINNFSKKERIFLA